jgi:hypothetical protein
VVGVLVLATAVVVTLGWSARRTTPVDLRVRDLAATGISLEVPRRWVPRRGGDHASVVMEIEHHLAFPDIPDRGMWVARWSAPDPAKELDAWKARPGRRSDIEIDGHLAQVHVERIGPPVGRAIPIAWSFRRTRYRFEANGLVYEIGFWDGVGSRDPELVREVLSSVRLHPPADRKIFDGGLAFRVPGSWGRGTGCDCWFAASHPPEAWVYVIASRDPDIDTSVRHIVDDAQARGEVAESVAITVGSQRAWRVRFRAHGPPRQDGGPDEFDVDDVVLPTTAHGHHVVILATAWRTPAGRSELDAVVARLVTLG